MKHRFIVTLCLLLVGLSSYAYRFRAFIPKENPTGTGVIVCPGGSYFWLDKQGEGDEVAQWLCDNGITAFVVEYSHGGWTSFTFHVYLKKRRFPEGFNDLCRALDEVRSHAAEYGVRTDRIGCMGFSAGGHLVMHAAEQLAGTSQAPYFVAPMYPVVSMTHPATHKRSRRGLLGGSPTGEMMDSLSVERHVPANCPPVFLMNCDDDPVVDPRNAILLDSALTSQHIPHQYEHYRTGGHGFGVSEKKTTKEAIGWKEQFLKWLQNLVNNQL